MATESPAKNVLEKTLVEIPAKSVTEISILFGAQRNQFDQDAAENCSDFSALETLRVKWLGRKSGVLAKIAENWLKPASPELRPIVGQALNELKAHVQSALEDRRQFLETDFIARAGAADDRVDLSLPGVRRPIGSRHIIRQTQEELERIFLSIGFSVVEGPEIETPYYNFEALNIPEHHPARDTMDTFYLHLPAQVRLPKVAEPYLLRTHTSPVQVRTMEKQQPPVRIVVPGKVYRHDNPDATHAFMFHQLEGLAVDTDITFCDFKGTIDYLAKQFFGPKVRTRLRPSYFQFTEPSAEVDGSCHVCDGKGCRICKYTGWIELFGAGMVNPAVYNFVNYDAKRLSGFAFGIGIDRFAMLKYGIDDLQLFFQNDVRFLRQFP